MGKVSVGCTSELATVSPSKLMASRRETDVSALVVILVVMELAFSIEAALVETTETAGGGIVFKVVVAPH